MFASVAEPGHAEPLATAAAARPASAHSPGPAKTVPLPLAQVREQLEQLCHGAQRTQGTGPLYRQYQQSLSRRQLAAMVREIRR